MLPFAGKTIIQPITGTRLRVACIRDGVVVSLQAVDSARIEEVRKRYDDVRELHDLEPCGEGWTVDDAGVYTPPPADDVDAQP